MYISDYNKVHSGHKPCCDTMPSAMSVLVADLYTLFKANCFGPSSCKPKLSHISYETKNHTASPVIVYIANNMHTSTVQNHNNRGISRRTSYSVFVKSKLK